MMTEPEKDTIRATAAVKAILDGRDSKKDMGAIMVTAEHAIAALLLMTMQSPSKAAGMLNEGIVPGVESRLSLFASKTGEC